MKLCVCFCEKKNRRHFTNIRHLFVLESHQVKTRPSSREEATLICVTSDPEALCPKWGHATGLCWFVWIGGNIDSAAFVRGCSPEWLLQSEADRLSFCSNVWLAFVLWCFISADSLILNSLLQRAGEAAKWQIFSRPTNFQLTGRLPRWLLTKCPF